MCTPLAIAGVALSAGAAVANAAADSKAASARDDALAAERIRQQGLDKEASALNVQSQDRYQDFEGQQEQKAATLGDYFTGQQTPEPTAAALPTSQSTVTVQEEGKQRGIASVFTDNIGNALGDLRAFGGTMGDIGRLQARDASLIGQLGGFKRGSANVLPLELDTANQKGGGLRTLGDVLRGAARATTAYSFGQQPEDWSGTTPSYGTTIDTVTPRPKSKATLRLGDIF